VSVVAAILEELRGDEDALRELAEALRPYLTPPSKDRWLNAAQAAEHIGAPVSRIYALTSARRIPHHKDGSRLLFRRSELDEWVRTIGGARRP